MRLVWVALYSPAVVLFAWAGARIFNVELDIAGPILLAVALLFHICAQLHLFSRRHTHDRSRH